MTIVKGIGIMKKRCKMIIALLSAAMVLTACAKNTSDTDSNKANDTKTQDTSKDAAQDDTETEKTKEYQAKLDMIEPFHPDRMASRILGMGDMLSFIEKAQTSFDEKQAAKLEEKLRKNSFTLQDYYDQLQQIRRMGDLSQIAGMLPGGLGKQLSGASIDEKQMAHTEAIILSMTPQERENPQILGASRKKRIAAGCGLQVVDVNRLLKQFEMMQQLTKQMNKMGRRPGMPGLGGRMHGLGRKKRLK